MTQRRRLGWYGGLTAACLIIVVSGIWPILRADRTFVWDPSVWYGLYHYFAESLYGNVFPLWDPYMNGGEPFWPLFGLFRLVDPLNILFVYIGRAFGLDIFHLYHIQFMAKYLVACIGVLLLLQHLLRNYLVSLAMALCYLMYCFTVNLYDAAYMTLSWFPFVLLFFFRYLERLKPVDLWVATYFLGLYVGAASYHFIFGIFTIACIVVVHIVINRRFWTARLWPELRQRPFMMVGLTALVLAMSLPALVTAREYSRELFAIARAGTDRALFENISSNYLDYKQLMGHQEFFTRTRLWDQAYIFPFAPGAKPFWQRGIAYLFLCLTALGIVFGKNRWKPHLLVVVVLGVFIILGTSTPVHKILTFVFPPLSLVRQTHVFLVIIFMIECYLAGLGIEAGARFAGQRYQHRVPKIISGIILAVVCFAALRGYFVSNTVKADTYVPDFKHSASAMKFIGTREFAMGRTRWYLYEPMLYQRNVALQTLAPAPYGTPPEKMPLFQEWEKAASADPNHNLVGPSTGFRTISWTKRYYKIYRLGEQDPQKFRALMSVGRPLLSFAPNSLTLSSAQFAALVPGCTAQQLERLLSDTAIIIDDRNADRASAPTNCAATATAPGTIAMDDPRASDTAVGFAPDHLTIWAVQDRAGYLVYSDMLADGWRAIVDGQSAPLLEVNGGFKGVRIAAGKHLVRFDYRPTLFMFSVGLYLALCVLAPPGLLVFWARGRLRRPPVL